MVKKKLAFVDHNYHKKTRCADFLRKIFSEHFIIDDYWWSLAEEDKLFEINDSIRNLLLGLENKKRLTDHKDEN